MRSLVVLSLLIFYFSPMQPAQAESLPSLTNRVIQAIEKGDDWFEAYQAAHASNNKALTSLFEWLYCSRKDSGASFERIRRFIDEHPDWPRMDTLQRRAEVALQSEAVDATVAIHYFAAHPPVTARGKLSYARMLLEHGGRSDKDRAIALVKDAWTTGEFEGEQEEKDILGRFKSYLDKNDHIERVNYLLWQGNTGAAQRSLYLVSKDQRKLAEARIALQRDEPGVDRFVDSVPNALRNHPGLWQDRFDWRVARKRTSGIREMLLSIPDDHPYPEKFWKVQNYQIRELLEEEAYPQAYAIAAYHHQKSGYPLVEAEWLAGWISLTYLKKTDESYKHFFALFQGSNTPVSKARGAYWAGKAAEKHGDDAIAQNWFREASSYPSTFYGQMGYLERNDHPPFRIPASPALDAAARRQSQYDDLPLLVRLLAKAKHYILAEEIIRHMAENAKSASEYRMIASIGREVDRIEIGVRVAKQALRDNIILPEEGYPIIGFRPRVQVDMSLVMALTRQESEFNSEAESSAGAMGLMQIMPATAKALSRQHGETYSRSKLKRSSTYNLSLGSLYIHDLLDRYDGYYPLAIASYNAGPGRVDKWLKEFGDPRKGEIDMLTWMERIPYSETRNYVQRVLENTQVYRYLHNPQAGAKLRLANDLGIK